MIRAAWLIVALVTVARLAAAFGLPLTGDEAYYWEWSRRLAAGYVDHPPGVAWTIWSFGQFGRAPGLVRLGFVICGIVATLALAACATTIARDRRAGAIAAVLFSLTPLASVAFASASPDGPFLMFWCLSIWLAARAVRDGRRGDFAALGVCCGGLLLSRIFGFALVAGLVAYALVPARRALWREGLWLTLVVTLAVFSPFLYWNATHDWVTFTFSLVHRHEGEVVRLGVNHLLALLGTQAAAYSPGIFIAALVLAVRPRDTMLAWTALPLLGFLLLFSLFKNVEVSWIFGPFATLCAMMGIAAVQLTERARRAWTLLTVAPAAVLLVLIFAVALAPGPIYAVLSERSGVRLRHAGPFEIFAYRPMATDVAQLARDHDAIVMTDGYGLSSVIDFDAGVPPVVVGYDWQGRESHAWYPDGMPPKRALFVDKEPLLGPQGRPDFARHLQRACDRVIDGGAHEYRYGSAPPRTFYFTWCEDLRPDGLAVLRWEREPRRS